jgi:hypothetical protein
LGDPLASSHHRSSVSWFWFNARLGPAALIRTQDIGQAEATPAHLAFTSELPKRGYHAGSRRFEGDEDQSPSKAYLACKKLHCFP